MILPGISGSYILLILGLYDVVIGSVRPGELRADPLGSLGIVVPVGIGAVLGVAVLSNVLKVVLERFTRVSHAVLLGLLIGSVLGLWPFQHAVHPALADEARLEAVVAMTAGSTPAQIVTSGQAGDLTEEEARELYTEYGDLAESELKLMALELETYPPDPARAGLAALAAVLGFLLTLALGGGTRRGSSGREPATSSS
jgi:hypothetical protein